MGHFSRGLFNKMGLLENLKILISMALLSNSDVQNLQWLSLSAFHLIHDTSHPFVFSFQIPGKRDPDIHDHGRRFASVDQLFFCRFDIFFKFPGAWFFHRKPLLIVRESILQTLGGRIE